MPVLHRREDGSGFYIRARVAGNWITWQVTIEGEAWLEETGFNDRDSVDLELVEMLRDKGWLYTAGTGPGTALEAGRPSFIRVGEGVKHPEFGIGEVREVLTDGACRIVFYREYPNTRDVPTGELSAVRSIELARERSAAYARIAQPGASTKAAAVGSLRAETEPRTSSTMDASLISRLDESSVTDSIPRVSNRSSKGCLASLICVGILLMASLGSCRLMINAIR